MLLFQSAHIVFNHSLALTFDDNTLDSWIAWVARVANCHTWNYPLWADKRRQETLNCRTDMRLPADCGLVADSRKCMAGVAITRVISLWVVAGCDRYFCTQYRGDSQDNQGI